MILGFLFRQYLLKIDKFRLLKIKVWNTRPSKSADTEQNYSEHALLDFSAV
jgi:hypothetical protein